MIQNISSIYQSLFHFFYKVLDESEYVNNFETTFYGKN